MKNNTLKLKNAFNKLIKVIKKGEKTYKQELTQEAFKSLVDLSPVSTGSYVLSHRIGINQKDTSVTLKKGPNPGLYKVLAFGNPARASALHEKAVFRSLKKAKTTAKPKALKQINKKLKKIGPDDSVIISNSIPHAVNVEYVGWMKTPPYQVYGLTYEYLRLKEKSIMKKVEAKMQADLNNSQIKITN